MRALILLLLSLTAHASEDLIAEAKQAIVNGSMYLTNKDSRDESESA